MKRTTLCNCLFSSSSRFPASHVWDIVIPSRIGIPDFEYPPIWQTKAASSFLRDNHLRTDIRIDISISRRPTTTKFGKQIHLEELTKLIKSQLAHDVVTTLDFGCILVATSDNVVTTLSQRCVSNVVTITKK